jgi:hypothetical protein
MKNKGAPVALIGTLEFAPPASGCGVITVCMLGATGIGMGGVAVAV